MPRGFRINPADNVATLLEDAPAGDMVTVLGDAPAQIRANQPVALGHKIALCDLKKDQPVIKFAVTIGLATRDISAGDWVHLHNCASRFDQRSGTLDARTGATTDTRYE